MEYALAEHDRRIANAVCLGVVSHVNTAKARCRVHVGGLTTDWLPWLATRAGLDRTWWAPDVGEQCVVLSPSGEMNQGVVLLGLYQDTHPAPSAEQDLQLTEYSDGTKVSYDRAAGLLTVDCVGDIVVKAARTLLVDIVGDVTVKSAANLLVDIVGDVTVKGAATLLVDIVGDITLRTPALVTIDAPTSKFTGDGEIQGATHTVGAVTFDAGMTGEGDVVSGGKSLESHTHSGVKAGIDTSGPPS